MKGEQFKKKEEKGKNTKRDTDRIQYKLKTKPNLYLLQRKQRYSKLLEFWKISPKITISEKCPGYNCLVIYLMHELSKSTITYWWNNDTSRGVNKSDQNSYLQYPFSWFINLAAFISYTQYFDNSFLTFFKFIRYMYTSNITLKCFKLTSQNNYIRLSYV